MLLINDSSHGSIRDLDIEVLIKDKKNVSVEGILLRTKTIYQMFGALFVAGISILVKVTCNPRKFFETE